MVAERRDGAAGRDPEPGLDHAAEHHAEPERARGVRHPDRLADAARLRELDVDPVRDLRAARRRCRAGGSPRRRRSGSASAPSASCPPSSPAGSGCSQYATPSSASCGSASSASSSDHHSLTSTCSGRSVTPRTARTRSTSSPSPPPSFSFSRWKRGAAFSARRAMSSGSPSQTVQEVGGPVRGRPEQLPDRDAEQLALEVVQRAVERRPRGVLARRQPRLDLLERERVVAEQRRRAPRRRRAPSAAVSS